MRENVSEGSDHVTIGGRRRHVIGYLGDFLFPPERANSPVASLSGGERNRLLMAKLFTQPANLLVLDEPTNDLDAETLELLEELLAEFTGTLLLVSHDRTFIDNVVTSVLAFEGDGAWGEYVGGYQRLVAAEARSRRTEAAGRRAATRAHRPKPAAAKKRLSYKEQRELDAMPQTIDALEAEQTGAAAAHRRSGVLSSGQNRDCRWTRPRSTASTTSSRPRTHVGSNWTPVLEGVSPVPARNRIVVSRVRHSVGDVRVARDDGTARSRRRWSASHR